MGKKKTTSRIDIVGQNGNEGSHYNNEDIMDNYQKYIHLSRYARWNEKEKRRETWEETVNRYIGFFVDKDLLHGDTGLDEILEAILNLEVMPSMRCMMTAGATLERDNVAGYNCSYLPISGEGVTKEIFVEEIEDTVTVGVCHPRNWDEAMYILMCGTGVGFSVERQYINNLPVVGEKLSRRLYSKNNKNFYGVDKEELSTYDKATSTIIVEDSKYGWSSALRILIVELYNGNFDIKWDVSKVRAAGERLKTFGGRASGPEPLVDLFKFAVEIFKNAKGRKLNSLECHDLMCKVGDIVVVGGVRRSALISLSNLTDNRLRNAKNGSFWAIEPQRQLANNSICYTEKPDIGTFMREWQALYDSKSGERGIFNRVASRNQAAKNGRRDSDKDFGTNPCSEIILRPEQFCNLSEVVVRPDDNLNSLKEKVRLATILGTLQSTLTDFKYLNENWKKNTEEERLLGVSLTGIMDHPVLSCPRSHYFHNDGRMTNQLADWLQELKEVAIETNKEWADKLGIPHSTAITCVKPSGTVSQLVNSASGIHPRYSHYYIRRVRGDNHDPITQFLIEEGVPHEPEISKESSTTVFSFPQEAPKESVTRLDKSAIEQLELWKIYQDNWCEHKPSITVYVKEHEWMEVGAWVYEHFDDISGISFLPYSDHVYQQAPYEEVTEEEYNVLKNNMPTIDWTKLKNFEDDDYTTGINELACTGGACEI